MLRPSFRFVSNFPSDRNNRLLHYKSGEEVLQEFMRGIQIVECIWELFHMPRLHGCTRLSVLLRVPPISYDAFFNSPSGYRGQYAQCPDQGERFNGSALQLLREQLMDAVQTKFPSKRKSAEISLGGLQAKIWINEKEPDVETHLSLEGDEIDFHPWKGSGNSDVGLRAPIGTEFEVKGAWLDSLGEIRTDLTKVERSFDIHKTGFS